MYDKVQGCVQFIDWSQLGTVELSSTTLPHGPISSSPGQCGAILSSTSIRLQTRALTHRALSKHCSAIFLEFTHLLQLL